MQWTSYEPDVADIANVTSQRQWFSDRADEADLGGRAVQGLSDGIGSEWLGDAAAAWKVGVGLVLGVLVGCRTAHQRAEDAMDSFREGLLGLRTVMDEVRLTEATWILVRERNQAIVAANQSWLEMDLLEVLGVDLIRPMIARIEIADAQAMIAMASKYLLEAQGRREDCSGRRRGLDSQALSGLAAARAALPKEFPLFVSEGKGAVPDSFGLVLFRETLAKLSNEQLQDLLVKESSGHVAELLAGSLPKPGDRVDGIDPALIMSLAGLTSAEATVDRRKEITALFTKLTPEQVTRLAILFPGLGNIDGVPFPARYAANRINIAGALSNRKDQQAGLASAVEKAQKKVDDLQKVDSDLISADGRHPDIGRLVDSHLSHLDLVDAENELAAAQKAATSNSDLIKNYTSYLTEPTPSYEVGPDGHEQPDRNGHQILIFSDQGPGAIAEVWGNPANAKQVGIAVPGTKTNMVDFPGTSKDQAQNILVDAFAQHQDSGSVPDIAMISWAGGEFPQNIPVMDGGLFPDKSAGDPSFAKDLGARLLRFSDAVSDIAPEAEIGVGGHSYGGSVVGEAEKLGMQVDRVIYIEAAGMGPDVHSIYDFPQAASTKYYQMTAPGDLIRISQRSGIHGSDPNMDPGIATLETGFVDDSHRPDSELLSGVDSHTQVFGTKSTAWQNIYSFYADKPMEIKTSYGASIRQPDYQPQWTKPATDVPYAEDHSESDWKLAKIDKTSSVPSLR